MLFKNRRPLQRNYPESADVDAAMQRVIKHGVALEGVDEFCQSVVCSDGSKVTFWATNFPYAYASNGLVKSKEGDLLMAWNKKMPSRKTVWAVADKIAELISDVGGLTCPANS
jgi:hypothetical protein